MKTFCAPTVVFALTLMLSSAAAVQPGDTHDQVIAEKGAPVGRMAAGSKVILRYADQSITLKDGKVVTIEAVVARPAAAPAPAPRPTPAPRVVARTDEAPPEAVWHTDHAAALAQAKEQGRKVFLFFTGSDWCGWCKRLNREILLKDEFVRYAKEKLVLVELDFPRGKALPDAVRAQNERLARRYKIRGYPTVIVLDASGEAVGRLGYQEGGPGPFIEALEKL